MQRYYILDSSDVRTKTPDSKPLTQPTESQKRKKNRLNSTYQRIRIQNHHLQTHYKSNLINMMTENKDNLKSRYAIKYKASKMKGTRLIRLIFG